MAFAAYVSITGKKQGQIKGDSKNGSRMGKWSDLHDANVVSGSGQHQHSPIKITKGTDSASPLLFQTVATGAILGPFQLPPVQKSGGGKPKHNPIVVTRAWGPASPQLLQAFSTNEVLNSVVFEITSPTSHGGETVVKRVTLTNAKISNISPHIGRAAQSGRALSDISFIYEDIRVDDPRGG